MFKNTVLVAAICLFTVFESSTVEGQIQNYFVSASVNNGGAGLTGQTVELSGIFGIDLNAVDNNSSADIGSFERRYYV